MPWYFAYGTIFHRPGGDTEGGLVVLFSIDVAQIQKEELLYC